MHAFIETRRASRRHARLVICGLMGTGVFFMFHCVLLLPTGLLSVSPSRLGLPPPRSTFQPHAHSLFPDIAHCLATSKGSILNMCPFKTVQEFIASGPHYVSLLNRSHVAALIRTYMYLQCRQSTYLRGVQIRMQAAFDNLAAGKCCAARYVRECTRGLISQCKKSSNLFLNMLKLYY